MALFNASDALRIGNNAVDAVYLGNVQVWGTSGVDKISWAPSAQTNPTIVYATDSNATFSFVEAEDAIIVLPGGWYPTGVVTSYNFNDISATFPSIQLGDPIPANPQSTPLQIEGGLMVSGGRNIRIIGGEITHNIDYLTGTQGTRGISNRAMNFGGIRGDVHIEGLKVSGSYLFEVLNLQTSWPDARLIVQNFKLKEGDTVLSLVGGGHEGGDIFQWWEGPSGVYFDKVSANSSYQGIFAQPDQSFPTPAPRITYIKRLDLDHWPDASRNARMVDIGGGVMRPNIDQGAGTRGWANGNKLLVMRPLQQGTAGEETGKKYVLEDAWFNGNLNFGSAPNWFTPNTTTDITMVSGTDSTTGSLYFEWVTTPQANLQIEGRAMRGLRPSGHFVNDSDVGIGYTPVGYLGALPALTPNIPDAIGVTLNQATGSWSAAWTAVSGASSYEAQYRTGTGIWTTATVTGTTATAGNTVLNDTMIIVRARSIVNGFTSGWSSDMTAIRDPASAGVTPPNGITGLMRWHRSDDLALTDGAAVSSWADRMGGAAMVPMAPQGTAPTYLAAGINGLPSVRSTLSSAVGLAVAMTLPVNMTFFIIWKRSGSTNNRGIISANTSTLSNAKFSHTYGTTVTDHRVTGYYTNGTATLVDLVSYDSLQPTASVGIIKDGETELIINGVSDGPTTGALTQATPVSSRLTIFAANYVNANSMVGMISEFGVYDHALSSAELLTLKTYINDRYAI